MTHYIDPNGHLVFAANDDERATLRDELESDPDRFESEGFVYEWWEHFVCNTEFDWVDPNETGDLTAAPMLGIRDQDGQVVERYAWMDYQIRSPQQQLLETGECRWMGGE